MQRIRDELRRALQPALALLTVFLLGALLIVLTDFEHLRRVPADPLAAIGGALADMFEGYAAMLSGAIGDPGRIVAAIQSGTTVDIAAAIRPVSETLLIATPFIFAGLGLAVSFRAGLFNLGVDGQFLIGGLGASITGALVAGHLPPMFALVVAVAGGTIAGGAYGFVPGFLKARTGAHEVITTLMLNGVAPNLAFLVVGLIGLSGPPAIPAVPRISDLPMIRVDYGFIVALAMAAVVSVLLFRTALGFELRAVGFNHAAARAAGIRPGRTTMLAMSLSGGLVGMGSAFFGLGPAFGLSGGPSSIGPDQAIGRRVAERSTQAGVREDQLREQRVGPAEPGTGEPPWIRRVERLVHQAGPGMRPLQDVEQALAVAGIGGGERLRDQAQVPHPARRRVRAADTGRHRPAGEPRVGLGQDEVPRRPVDRVVRRAPAQVRQGQQAGQVGVVGEEGSTASVHLVGPDHAVVGVLHASRDRRSRPGSPRAGPSPRPPSAVRPVASAIAARAARATVASMLPGTW